jgi:uncharacterized protein DUF4386
MEDREVQVSPQAYARVGGALYLIIIVIGFLGEALVRGRLVVPGDPTATAERIRASEFLWRASIGGEFILLTCGVALTLILYVLLRPVSRELALMAVFFNLVSIAIEGVASLQLLTALVPLGNASYLAALDPGALNALTFLFIRSHEYGFGIALIFFGWVCLIDGHLIRKSGYLPNVVGVLMQVAGLCYLINSFAVILSPALAHRLFPAILLPALIGEASLCLWLLVKGVNVSKWKARAGMEGATA